jgi:hypothetical protein
MVEQTKAKKVPWAHLEKYLETHQVAIATYLDLKKNNLMDAPDIEARLPRSFIQLHEVITKILKDNNILPQQEESKTSNADKTPSIIKKFVNLQNTLVSHNSRHHESIKFFIESINS